MRRLSRVFDPAFVAACREAAATTCARASRGRHSFLLRANDEEHKSLLRSYLALPDEKAHDDNNDKPVALNTHLRACEELDGKRVVNSLKFYQYRPLAMVAGSMAYIMWKDLANEELVAFILPVAMFATMGLTVMPRSQKTYLEDRLKMRVALQRHELMRKAQRAPP